MTRITTIVFQRNTYCACEEGCCYWKDDCPACGNVQTVNFLLKFFKPLTKLYWRKRENLATNATQISKHVFPSVLSRLFSDSIFPEHLVSRFRAASIHPLSASAIKAERLKTAIPFIPSSESIQQSHLLESKWTHFSFIF